MARWTSALKLSLPRFVKKELEGYLDCGLLCRGFARSCWGSRPARRPRAWTTPARIGYTALYELIPLDL